MSELAYIGVGSNVADPEKQVRKALDDLATLGALRRSSLYRSEPLGDPAQPWFVNAVAELSTEVEPGRLLEELKRLEREAGRPQETPLWAPRVLDLDLLLHGQRVVREPALQVPHPRFRERRFVLEPLAELSPELLDPVSGKRVAELLACLDDRLQVEKLSGSGAGSGSSSPRTPTRRPGRPEVCKP